MCAQRQACLPAFLSGSRLRERSQPDPPSLNPVSWRMWGLLAWCPHTHPAGWVAGSIRDLERSQHEGEEKGVGEAGRGGLEIQRKAFPRHFRPSPFYAVLRGAHYQSSHSCLPQKFKWNLVTP